MIFNARIIRRLAALATLAFATTAFADAGDPLPVQVANLDAQSTAAEANLSIALAEIVFHNVQHEEREPLVQEFAGLLVEVKRLTVEQLLLENCLRAPHAPTGPTSAAMPLLLFGGDPGPAPEEEEEEEDEDSDGHGHGHEEAEGAGLESLDFALFVVEEAIHSAEEQGLDRDFETAEEHLALAEAAREATDVTTALREASTAYCILANCEGASGISAGLAPQPTPPTLRRLSGRSALR